MKKTAIIPLRSGSKSIPGKNTNIISGKPLMNWVLDAAVNAKVIDEVIVATDGDHIAKTALSLNHPKIKVFRRSEQTANDSASSESVLIEYLKTTNYESDDYVFFIQATNPFLLPTDLENAFQLLKAQKADSLLSVVKSKRFFWDHTSKSTNYDFRNRPRRQDFLGDFMENGSFYISNANELIRSGNRLHGKIIFYEMDAISATEIDEPIDWQICETLLNFRRSQSV